MKYRYTGIAGYVSCINRSVDTSEIIKTDEILPEKLFFRINELEQPEEPKKEVKKTNKKAVINNG